jgi:hypothetical protein
VHPGEKRIDGKAVMERVRRERDRFVGFVLEGVDNIRPRTSCAAMRASPVRIRCRSTSTPKSRPRAS